MTEPITTCAACDNACGILMLPRGDAFCLEVRDILEAAGRNAQALPACFALFAARFSFNVLCGAVFEDFFASCVFAIPYLLGPRVPQCPQVPTWTEHAPSCMHDNVNHSALPGVHRQGRSAPG